MSRLLGCVYVGKEGMYSAHRHQHRRKRGIAQLTQPQNHSLLSPCEMPKESGLRCAINQIRSPTAPEPGCCSGSSPECIAGRPGVASANSSACCTATLWLTRAAANINIVSARRCRVPARDDAREARTSSRFRIITLPSHSLWPSRRTLLVPLLLLHNTREAQDHTEGSTRATTTSKPAHDTPSLCCPRPVSRGQVNELGTA